MKGSKAFWKRLGAGALALSIAGGCTFGGKKIYDQYHGGPVEVFGVEDLSTTYWGDEAQTEGLVTTDRMQAEYLSDTQTVEKMMVKEGQKVKKGDVLFTYDSTLSDIDLKRKKIELMRKQMELSDAKNELKVIKTYRAGVPIPGSTGDGSSKPSKPSAATSSSDRYTPLKAVAAAEPFQLFRLSKTEKEKPTWPGLVLMYGDGSEEDPYCYVWRDDFQYTDDFLAAATQGEVEAFVHFYLNGKDVEFPTPTPIPEPDSNPDSEFEEEPDVVPDQDAPSPQEPEQNSGHRPGRGPRPNHKHEQEQKPEPEPEEKNPEPETESDSTTEPEPDVKEPGQENESVPQPEEPMTEQLPDESIPEEETAEGSDVVVEAVARGGWRLDLLTATDEDEEWDEENHDEDEKEEDGEENEEQAAPYSAGWTMQIQHTLTGYRYVILSMTVGGMERQICPPLPPLDPTEYPKEEEDGGNDSGDRNDSGGLDGFDDMTGGSTDDFGGFDDFDVDDFDDFDDFGGGDFDDGFVEGVIYTSAEIAEMIRDTEQTIRDLDLECRQLKLDVKKVEQEVSNSAIYAKLDGVVTTVNSKEDANQGMPVLKISCGGGYLVKGTISELDLQSVQPGMSVTIDNWMTGDQYEGTVSEISEYPSSDSGAHWGSGNNNVSYYAFTVSVDESANLEENNYVEMIYTPSTQTSGSQNIYLMRSFVRSENGQSFVYLDKDGTLEKVNVRTGKDLWGSYVEITSHNLPDDAKLAFPYGQKVRENAPTVEGELSSLYGY